MKLLGGCCWTLSQISLRKSFCSDVVYYKRHLIAWEIHLQFLIMVRITASFDVSISVTHGLFSISTETDPFGCHPLCCMKALQILQRKIEQAFLVYLDGGLIATALTADSTTSESDLQTVRLKTCSHRHIILMTISY
jgi:hypothetical protein